MVLPGTVVSLQVATGGVMNRTAITMAARKCFDSFVGTVKLPGPAMNKRMITRPP